MSSEYARQDGRDKGAPLSVTVDIAYITKGETPTTTPTAFVVHKSIVGNVISFKGGSDRVAQLTIKIKGR